MMSFEQALTTFGIERIELTAWIDQSWVRPLRQGDDWHFDDLDVARLQLICDLRREMAVNDEAIPVVLELLDQLYATRATLAQLRDAIERLPEPGASELRAILDRDQPKA
jgi:chaperone modulatory protein CbpM